jgi:hypothetical protein
MKTPECSTDISSVRSTLVDIWNYANTCAKLVDYVYRCQQVGYSLEQILNPNQVFQNTGLQVDPKVAYHVIESFISTTSDTLPPGDTEILSAASIDQRERRSAPSLVDEVFGTAGSSVSREWFSASPEVEVGEDIVIAETPHDPTFYNDIAAATERIRAEEMPRDNENFDLYRQRMNDMTERADLERRVEEARARNREIRRRELDADDEASGG